MTMYKLLIQKRYHKKRRETSEAKFSLFFAVVDLDKGTFPCNYICDLPKYFKDTKYSQFFDQPIIGLLTAKELLEKAKEDYNDLAVRQEIEIRLSKIKQSLEIMSQKQKVELLY